MRSRIGSAVIAGLIAGIPFGIMMQVMQAPTPEGVSMPMMAMVAQILRSDSIAVGWVYHLFNSAVIGGLFGWLLGARVRGVGGGLGWGALYGVAWWVLGGLVLMPLLLGMPAFASLTMASMRPVAIGSLMGHLLYGLVLGGLFGALHRESAGQIGQMRTAH